MRQNSIINEIIPPVIRQRRSGATSSRRGTTNSGQGGSHNDQQQPPQALPTHPGPRRWANLVPGFLKLELVRQVDDAVSATGNASSSSSKKALPEGQASTKGTFWENAPHSLPLHVNALITASVNLTVPLEQTPIFFSFQLVCNF